MDRPNFIVIMADNLGYGDWGCLGNPHHRTPHTDRMAAQGMILAHHYSTSGVCSPSRASLMTGCYPRRVSMHLGGLNKVVLFPLDPRGLHPSEITIATLLKQAGYATACIGKWHLGDQLPYLPTRHGFDEYFGVPYSDDMTPRPEHPDWPPLPLMHNETVIEAGVDRNGLTRRYTEKAVEFIRANRGQPFFLYLPHAMPGSTRRPFASPAFQGKSANGPYGDSIEEMDWSTGEILKTLDELGLDEKTLVMTTSDHGAVRFDPPQGSCLPLKGFGYDISEGGMRPPCVVRWPGRIPAGAVCRQITTHMDVFPTLASLAGAALPGDRVLDGHDMLPLLLGHADAVSPYDASGFFYYHRDQLQAVRAGRWKLYLPLDAREMDLSRRVEPFAMQLFDLIDDVGETREVSAENPRVVSQLMQLAQHARAELGDRGVLGRGQRPAGWLDDPQPCVIR